MRKFGFLLTFICYCGICFAQKDSVGGMKTQKPPDYQSCVSKGDLAISAKDYLTAKRFYKQAMLAKPGDTYSSGQIDVCDKKMSSGSWMSTELDCPCHSGKVTKKFDESTSSGNIQVSANDTLVYSIFPGKVSSVSSDSGGHTIVLIQHGKYMATYSNLDGTKLQVGDEIKEGESVGYFNKQKKGLYSLTFSIWDGKEKEDPKKYVHCKSQQTQPQ